MSLNKVSLIGRPTTILEIKRTADHTALVSFTLAVSESKDKTNFIEVVAFGNNAEYLYKYLKDKGRVYLSGVLKNNNYVKNGVKTYSYLVSVKEVVIIDFREKEQNSFQENLAENYINF